VAAHCHLILPTPPPPSCPFQYFTPTSDFFEARAATTQAAADLHGTNSPEVSAVKAAWDVVGVPTAPDGTRPTCDAIYATAAAC
jgi:hypothetical protein